MQPVHAPASAKQHTPLSADDQNNIKQDNPFSIDFKCQLKAALFIQGVKLLILNSIQK
jgi:hypothetical protein